MNEATTTEKKQWTKPELIVLVRNKSEEAVLSQCKGYEAWGPGGQWYCGCPTPGSECSFCGPS
jgi:hypothetical protein